MMCWERRDAERFRGAIARANSSGFKIAVTFRTWNSQRLQSSKFWLFY
ncbi:MAG: hypothetical protein HC878_10515 [Leptolyngbyaceae cyanobacterium SL_5_14]|nr:hypothetical protein [Leptolyngbyaceae cyanobacterium SL_5_14]